MSKSIEQLALEAVDNYARRNRVGSSLRGHDEHGEAEGLVDNPNDLQVRAGTQILMKDMADLLTKRFPGFHWAIQPSEIGGVFNVFCLDFHARWGYVIRMADIINDPRRRAVIKAGHEILRRFRYPADRYDAALMAAIPRNGKGEAMPRTDGLKKTRHTDSEEVQYAFATGRAKIIGTHDGRTVVEVRK